MKRNLILVFFLVFGLVLAVTARADTIHMYFNGAGGNQSGGVYVYPYNFTLNGTGPQYPLLCDSFNIHISDGDQWDAYHMSLMDLNNSNVSQLFYANIGVQGYLAAAYLFVEEAQAFQNGNSDPDGLFNWAIWDLMQQSDVSGGSLNGTQEAQVQADLAAALVLTAGHVPGDFAWADGVVIYTPTDGTGQEFFGPTAPEPGSLVLFGSGVLGLAGVLRRKLIG